MASGPYDRILELLEDLDARLAGLEVGYSEANATAARELVEDVTDFFDGEPEHLAGLQDAVDRLVETEDSAHAADAKEHADELRRRVRAQVDEES